MKLKAYFAHTLIVLVFLGIPLAACTHPAPAPDTPVTATSPVVQEEITVTSVPPSATPLALAAMVNGEPLTLAEYQIELDLFQAASGEELSEQDKARVLEDLIGRVLLAQAADGSGFTVDAGLLAERIQNLEEQLGGARALAEWISQIGFSRESFEYALQREIAAAWMRDQIIAQVPLTTEQVHATQILLYNPDEAEEVFSQLEAGYDFGNLATQYDPLTGGDLGWFPRGYLPFVQIEEAAFGLDVGQFSPVIETLAGYHIILVLERDPQHLLTPDALLVLQAQAVVDWVVTQRIESDIQILLP